MHSYNKLTYKNKNIMKNSTITLFVQPKDLPYFLQVLKILDHLEIDNNYTFNPLDLDVRQEMISNFVWFNIDINLYLKFWYKYKSFK